MIYLILRLIPPQPLCMSDALFRADNVNPPVIGVQENDDDYWDLPKLKVPEKGKAISESFAKMINVACTSQCDIDPLLYKYSIPQNCQMASPPLVNPEIWKILHKRIQTQDRAIVTTQNLVAASMIPIIKLADILKPFISGNVEAKSLLSDALTLLGHVQFSLSIRRRYMIRPALKKKNHSLCNISRPISTLLFGDEISKEIKSCDSVTYLGRNDTFSAGRGRGAFGKYPRKGLSRDYGSDEYGGHRYQPYPQRGQFKFNSRRGFRKSATAPNPNEQS